MKKHISKGQHLKKINNETITIDEVINVFKVNHPDNYKCIIERLPYFIGKEKKFLLRVLNDSISSIPLFYNLYNSLKDKMSKVIADDKLSENEKIQKINTIILEAF